MAVACQDAGDRVGGGLGGGLGGGGGGGEASSVAACSASPTGGAFPGAFGGRTSPRDDGRGSGGPTGPPERVGRREGRIQTLHDKCAFLLPVRGCTCLSAIHKGLLGPHPVLHIRNFDIRGPAGPTFFLIVFLQVVR